MRLGHETFLIEKTLVMRLAVGCCYKSHSCLARAFANQCDQTTRAADLMQKGLFQLTG